MAQIIKKRPMVEHAIILAGGKGERLRPHTDDRPKSMVEIGGKPIIEYQLDQLKAAGVKHVVFTLSYMKEAVIKYINGKGKKYGMEMTYTIEEPPRGRGGGIKMAMQAIKEDWRDVIALNGDNLWKIDFEELFKLHSEKDALATVVVSQLRSPYGIVDFNQKGEIQGFIEKPLLPNWLNDGVYIFSRETLDGFPDIGDHEDTLFPNLPPEKFIAFKNTVYWRGVDTAKDLIEANAEVKDIFK